MTNLPHVPESRARYRPVFIAAIALLNAAGVLYFANYFLENGYLPGPFVYDKSDTFMDLFNPMYWAYDDGRYTEWGSVYPPLSFLILKIVNIVFSGSSLGDPFLIRDDSPLVIAGFCLMCMAIPAALLVGKYWWNFSRSEKLLLYVAIISSAPMLFSIERGNMIVLCPALLGLAIGRIGVIRSFSIALLINIKPYLALLLFYYVVRRNWRGFVVCSGLAGLIFVVSGLFLDGNFPVFFANLFCFSQDDGIFSLREVMSLPSSISAFSYVLNNPDGYLIVSSYLSQESVALIINLLEAVKWGVLLFSLVVLIARSSVMRDAEIIALLVVAITNLGVWVGGYTYILYISLIPVFLSMRASWLYLVLLIVIAAPLDVIPLVDESTGVQYSFLSNAFVDVHWTLGLASLVRPVVNFFLLFTLCLMFWRSGDFSSGRIARILERLSSRPYRLSLGN